MKKFGFTLAEVLITLTIIGVVSALVLPTFISGVQRQRIGPKLGKAVSMFEQATQAMLDDAQSDSISGAMVRCTENAASLSPLADSTSNACFVGLLGSHLKGSANGTIFTGSDGVSYTIGTFNAAPALFPTGGAASRFSHNNIIMNDIMIDINPAAANPTLGFDTFHFYMMDDGSLVPYGSTRDIAANRWTATCPREDDGAVTDYNFCAGHVMENNLKVDYR